MIRPGAILQGLKGVFALLENRPDWESRFDLSHAGIWASFWAIPLSIPLAAFEQHLMTAFLIPLTDDVVLLPGIWPTIYVLLSVTLSWILALFAIAQMVKSGDYARRYSIFLVAFNWASFLIYALRFLGMFFVLKVLSIIGGASLDAVAMLSLILMVFTIFVLWAVCRRSFQAGIGTTVGMLILIVVTSLLGSLALRAVLSGLLL